MAPRDINQSSLERVRSLTIILDDVEILLSEQEFTEAQEKNLRTVADNCRCVLENTQNTLNKYSSLESRGKSIGSTTKRVWNRLKWEPDDIRDLRARVTSNITLLNAFVEGYTRDNVVKLVRRQDQQDYQEILDWLTIIDHAAQQSDFIRRRQAETGLWLLDSPEYKQWIATDGKTLFCPGFPGVGKTILTSVVVESLYDSFSHNSSIGICYFYFDYRRKEEHNLDNIMLSILKQLAQRQPFLDQSVKDLYKKCQEKRTRPSLDEVRKALYSMAASYSKTFVVIDALDECQSVDGSRAKFISELLDFQTMFGANILATSRFIPEISDRFRGSKWQEIRAHQSDIEKYLDSNMPYLPGCVSNNINLQKEIKENIIECVDGMYVEYLIYSTNINHI